MTFNSPLELDGKMQGYDSVTCDLQRTPSFPTVVLRRRTAVLRGRTVTFEELIIIHMQQKNKKKKSAVSVTRERGSGRDLTQHGVLGRL